MFKDVLRVLVPLDGSEEAESILSALNPLAEIGRLRLTLFRMVGSAESAAAAEHYLAGLLESLRRRRLPAEAKCDQGSKPAKEIVWLGNEARYDLIAMSTHGRTGLLRTLLGSVTEEVLHHADIPLLVNRPNTRTGDWKKIVVGLDGSSMAEEILPDAVRLARMFGASIHLVRAVMPAKTMGVAEGAYSALSEDPVPYLWGVCKRLGRKGISSVSQIREGPPAAEICAYADRIGAGLISIASHGRTGLGRLLLGSTTEEVLRRAPCPVFLRRTSDMAAAIGAVEPHP